MTRRWAFLDDLLIMVAGFSILGLFYLQQQNVTYHQTLSTTHATQQGLEEQLRLLREAKSDLEVKLGAAQGEANTTKQSLAKETSVRQSLEKDVKELTSSKTSLEKTLTERLDAKTKELGALIAAREEMTQTLTVMTEDIGAKKKEIDSLEDQVQSRDLRIAQLEQETGKLKEAVTKVQAAAPPAVSGSASAGRFLDAAARLWPADPLYRVEGQHLILQSDALFDSNQQLTAAGQEALNKVLQQFRVTAGANNFLVVDVHANADVRTDPLAPALSAAAKAGRQADAIKAYANQLGFAPFKIVTRVMADAKPLDPRQDEFATRRNQRLELSVGGDS